MKIIRVEDSDLQEIEGNRLRTIQAISAPLTAAIILDDIRTSQRQRVIVICNTVSQAQGLFRDLQALAEEDKLHITLLHSRFLPEHRAKKEAFLKEAFAENWQRRADGICHVLIATQVIEAGINITCEVMHVQLCPMNSLLQRVGRCARFRGERGEVYVYYSVEVDQSQWALATRDFDSESSEETSPKQQHSFLPYTKEICELTWQVLQQHTTSDQNIGFRLEEAWINEVHRDEDILQIGRRQNKKMDFEESFVKAVFQGDRSTARDLIRLVDSRNVFVWEEPILIDSDCPEIDPNKLQAFSLPISTLCKVLRDAKNLEYEIDWVFRRIESPSGKAAETYSLPVWTSIESLQALKDSFRILVNPKYVYYDENIGLVISLEEEGDSGFRSPEKSQKSISKEYKYRMDTYVGHLGCLWTCWREAFTTEIQKNGELVSVTYGSVRNELLAPGGRSIAAKIFPEATVTEAETLFEYLVFLAIIIHDLGKLQVKWQEAVRGWQAIAHSSFGGKNPKSYLLAHTDSDPENIAQQKARRDYERKHRRPPHAVESAFIGQDILKQSLVPLLRDYFDADTEQCAWIAHTVVMAAGRHHSAWAKGDNLPPEIKLHPLSVKALAQSWDSLARFLPQHPPLPKATLRKLQYATRLDFDLNKFDKYQSEYYSLYLLVVRALRLCDTRAVQL